MKKTYFEKEVGIKKEVFSEKKHLYLSAFGKGSKAEVDFLFEYGPDNAQDAKELWALSDYLTKNSRGGLVALLMVVLLGWNIAADHGLMLCHME